jgi:hypothetical protein
MYISIYSQQIKRGCLGMMSHPYVLPFPTNNNVL